MLNETCLGYVDPINNVHMIEMNTDLGDLTDTSAKRYSLLFTAVFEVK